ncbi:hypothetical protein ACQP2X_48850 [Actinoplanes sp. CA-131856]
MALGSATATPRCRRTTSGYNTKRAPVDAPAARFNVPRQHRPATAALADLERRDQCGSVELAGTAVGAAFVGTVTAALAIVQSARAALTGDGLDTITIHMQTDDVTLAPATANADVIAAELATPQ